MGGPDRSAVTVPLQAAAVWSRLLVGGTALVTAGHALGLPVLSPGAVLVIAGLGLLAGIPHGGADHLVAMRLAGRPLVPVVLGYAGVAAVAWVTLRWGGPIALLAVVAVSALHFGMGELQFTTELTGWRPPPPVAAALVVAGAGAVLLPLARSGREFSNVAAAVSPGLAQLIGAPPFRTAILVVWLAAAAVAVAAALRTGNRSAALDVVLIGVLGMLAPPLVAFAVWFGGWHSLRHFARLLGEEPGCAAMLADGRPGAACRRLARLAAPMSLAAIAVALAVVWFVVTAPDAAVVLAEALRLLLALTVPHMVVVWWLDRSRAPAVPAAQ